MIIFDRPYFLENEEWYEINDGEGRGYILTDKAPQKAIDSYNQYYAEMDLQDSLRPLFGLKKK